MEIAKKNRKSKKPICSNLKTKSNNLSHGGLNHGKIENKKINKTVQKLTITRPHNALLSSFSFSRTKCEWEAEQTKPIRTLANARVTFVGAFDDSVRGARGQWTGAYATTYLARISPWYSPWARSLHTLCPPIDCKCLKTDYRYTRSQQQRVTETIFQKIKSFRWRRGGALGHKLEIKIRATSSTHSHSALLLSLFGAAGRM